MHLVGNVLVLHRLVQRGQTPECLFVIVRGVFGHQVRTNAVQRLAVFGNGIGEVPHHGTRLGIAKHVAAMHLEHHPLDAA